MNASELLQDNDLFLLDSFSAEQCPKNSEIIIDSLEEVPEIAGISSPTQVDPKVSAVDPPKDFFSALEAASMRDPNLSWDMRPHVMDGNSGQYILLDSGAQVSACPPDPGDPIDPSIALKAVNGSRLNCYGYKTLDIKINRKTYSMKGR